METSRNLSKLRQKQVRTQTWIQSEARYKRLNVQGERKPDKTDVNIQEEMA